MDLFREFETGTPALPRTIKSGGVIEHDEENTLATVTMLAEDIRDQIKELFENESRSNKKIHEGILIIMKDIQAFYSYLRPLKDYGSETSSTIQSRLTQVINMDSQLKILQKKLNFSDLSN